MENLTHVGTYLIEADSSVIVQTVICSAEAPILSKLDNRLM